MFSEKLTSLQVENCPYFRAQLHQRLCKSLNNLITHHLSTVASKEQIYKVRLLASMFADVYTVDIREPILVQSLFLNRISHTVFFPLLWSNHLELWVCFCLFVRYEPEPAGHPNHSEWRPSIHRRDAEWRGVLGVQHPGAGGSYAQEVERWWKTKWVERPIEATYISCESSILINALVSIHPADLWRTSGWRSSRALECAISWTAPRPHCALGYSSWKPATTPLTPTTTPRTLQTSCTLLPTSSAKRESRLEEKQDDMRHMFDMGLYKWGWIFLLWIVLSSKMCKTIIMQKKCTKFKFHFGHLLVWTTVERRGMHYADYVQALCVTIHHRLTYMCAVLTSPPVLFRTIWTSWMRWQRW